jgi:hypothetical protein
MVTFQESGFIKYLHRPSGLTSSSGITSFEEIIEAAGEAFNMERDLAAALAAFGMVGYERLSYRQH